MKGKLLLNSENKEDIEDTFRKLSMTSFIYYYENTNLTAWSHNVTVRELSSQLYNRIEYKKGSHCSGPCTLALTDL